MLDTTDSVVAVCPDHKIVLVAEDEVMIRLMIVDLLEQEGYSVLHANDGAQAWNLFKQNRDHIHIVITDVLMPAMSGIELRNKIGALSPTTKVLFISGYVRQDTCHLVGLRETEMLLTKPFNVETLVTKVREMSS